MPETPDAEPARASSEEFSQALDEVLDLYEPGVLPGCSAIEITQASRFGFTQVQIQESLADAELLAVIRRSWDLHGVPDVVRRQASTPGTFGELLEQLLRSTGHALEMDETVSDINWVLLADSVLAAGATKGATDPDFPDVADETWTVDDRFVGSAVLVAREGVGYRVRCVPEITRGPAVLALRWRTGGDTRLAVTVVAGEVIDQLVEGPSGEPPVAIAFVGR